MHSNSPTCGPSNGTATTPAVGSGLNQRSWATFLVTALATTLATGLLGACAALPGHAEHQLRPLTGFEAPAYPLDDLQAVSEGMKAFVDLHLPDSMNHRQRTWKLAMVTADKYILQFRYDPGTTLPPDQTFAMRRGNCLSFSLMLMAMARYAGIPARLQEVVLPPEYRSENDTFISSRHINVRLGDNEESFIVDVSGKDISNSTRIRTVSQREAEAQYYNNLGVDALLDSDLPAAWARFQQAIQTEPRMAFLWSNLGVVYNRNGQTSDAEWAYEVALSANNDDTSALNNLYVIYQQEGRWLEAARLEQKVDRHRRKNPYYLAMLADEAVRSRQYNEAIALLKRSIRINAEEYRFHGAMAQAQYLAGNSEKAMHSLDTARALAPASDLENLSLTPELD